MAITLLKVTCLPLYASCKVQSCLFVGGYLPSGQKQACVGPARGCMALACICKAAIRLWVQAFQFFVQLCKLSGTLCPKRSQSLRDVYCLNLHCLLALENSHSSITCPVSQLSKFVTGGISCFHGRPQTPFSHTVLTACAKRSLLSQTMGMSFLDHGSCHLCSLGIPPWFKPGKFPLGLSIKRFIGLSCY